MMESYAFGTAQFSGKYGITNKTGILLKKEVIKILKYLKKKKIYHIDTSTDYKQADQKINSIKFRKWKIITKINPNIVQKLKTHQEIQNKIENILDLHKKKLGVKKIHCLLLRNEKYLMKKNSKNLFLALKNLKKKNFFQKFGYSIYSFKNLKKLFNIFHPDVIQCPFNIFDRRLINTENYTFLKKNKVEIHVRSIFLQGLLLSDIKDLPKKFKNWNNHFKKWDQWAQNSGLSKLDICVNYPNSIPLIKRIIFGVENFNQLKQILNVKKKKIICPKYLETNNKKLIDPSRW